MANSRIFEKDINKQLSHLLSAQFAFVKSCIRIQTDELDVVTLNPQTLELTNFEIKMTNSKKLLKQALRGKRYCHYSVVVVPKSAKESARINKYYEQGIGVVLFEAINGIIKFVFDTPPIKSNLLNRGFKKKLYSEFSTNFIME